MHCKCAPLSNRQFDEFHRLLLYCCLLSNILYGNCGWLNALFSTRRNCPLQFVAWKGYQKRKEGRGEQLWWLRSKEGERKLVPFEMPFFSGQGMQLQKGAGQSHSSQRRGFPSAGEADGDRSISAPARTGSNKPTCPRQPDHPQQRGLDIPSHPPRARSPWDARAEQRIDPTQGLKRRRGRGGEQEDEWKNQMRKQQREGRRKPQRKGWRRGWRGGGWQEESVPEREDGRGERGRRGDGRQCLLIFCLAAFGAIALRSWSRSTLY